MRAIWKWIVPVLTAAAFLTAMWYGINTYGWPGYTSTARALPGPWAYETDAGDAGLVRLPWTLALPSGTGQVALTAVLPKWEDEGYALHFKTMAQAVEVRVGGETRYTFGGSAGAKDFVYRAATHINEVPLTQADSGRDVAIILRSPPLFRTELGLLRAIWFGTQGDLVRHQFHDGLFTMLVSLSTLLITFSALLILLTYQGASLKQNLRLFLLAVLAVLFFNTENAALWPIFHHSPVLSSLLDWFFYILDPLLPLAAWMVLYTLGLRFRRWQKIWALGTGCAYIAATALSLFGAFPFNLTRPPFMVCSMAFTLALVLGRRGEDGALPALTVPVLILLLGYYLDYLKYVLMVLPFSARWSSFLQLELPFQFCTGVALTAFSLLTLRATMEALSRMEADARAQTATAQIQAQYAIHQYESICQRDAATRQLRHDMQHHFRTAVSLLEQGRAAEAERYLAGLADTATSLQAVRYCADQVADLTIGWYASCFSKAGVPFAVKGSIPPLREEAHADICCILSNALQNALEGSAGVELRARPKGNALLLRVRNRTLLRSATQFPTTKKGRGHGLGLASMRAAAQRHGGSLRAEAQDGVFWVDTVLYGVIQQEEF